MPDLPAAIRAAETEAANGNPTGARDLLVDAVGAAVATLGPDHLDVLAAQTRLAAVHRELGALHEARRVLETVLEMGHRTHGAGHPQLLPVSYELAVLASELGNAYEAGRNFRLLRKWGPDVLGADHPHVLAARRYLGEAVEGGSDTPTPPPPLPLPPVGPPAPGQSILDSSAPARRRFPVTAAVAGMALLAVVATVVAVWAIPERGARVAPPLRAGPVGPTGSPSPDSSASAEPSLSASDSGVPIPDGSVRTPPRTVSSTTAARTLGGRYVIHLAHTGMCMGLGPELFKNTGRTVLGQHPCGSALPQFTVEAIGTNVYRILVTDEDGSGCADVDYAGDTDGLLLAPQTCAERTDQRFTFENVNTPVAGYRMRSVAGSQWCIGVLEGKRQSGVQLIQNDCDGGAHQVFTLERR